MPHEVSLQPDDYLTGLNDEQRRAVAAQDGPFLILAGAGTGKTKVITQRIAYLVASGRAKPEDILALTFTDKAAGEMVERVDRLLPYGYLDLRISTFHSFCERVLKEHGLAIGLPNDFRLVNETDAYLLVRRNFARFQLDYYRPRANPTKFIHALLKHFSRAKDEAVSPAEYQAYAERAMATAADEEARAEAKRCAELAGAYATYQQLLLEHDSLDFGDLQTYALELLQKRPAVLAQLRRQYRYVLVDEFQDTNWAQYALVKLLVPPEGNLMVVGDDDQSIYKFRGASVSNILQFKNDYPTAREVVLTRNYRSRQGILDLAYNFIRQNDPNRLEAKLAGPDGSGVSKRLVADRDGDAVILPMPFGTSEDEAEGIVRKMVELRAADPALTWSEFCVLTRSNSGAEEVTLALERAQVPYQFLALKGLYAKPVVMDLLAYFQLLDDYHESTAMWRTLCSPPYRIAGADLLAMTHEARKKAESLFEVCRRLSSLPGIAEETLATVSRLMDDLARHTQLARTKSSEEVLITYLFDSGYLRLLTEGEETLASRQALSCLVQFRKRLRRFEQQNDDRSLKHFLEEYALEREAGEEGSLAFDPETGPDMVRVMTVHAAKGLEFPHVFIMALVDKRFPSVARGGDLELPDALTKEIVPEGDIHLEEERRLFYVAATRARDGLYLTWAEDYGGKTKKKPSRFLQELGFVASEEKKPRKKKADQAEFAAPPAEQKLPPPPDEAPKHFSYSALEAYGRCPAQYRFAHILRIPTFGNYKSSFGNTMHLALQRFFEEVARRRVEAPGVAGLPVSKEELLDMYDDAWIDDWYPDKPTKDDWRELGRRALERIWDETLAHDPKVLFLEKEFVLKVGERSLRGKIDRLDELPDGAIEVVDYKSGEPKSEEDLKADGKKQLYIYQLAVEQCLGRKVGRLTFRYLQDGSSVSFLGAEKDLTKLEEKIAEQVAAIESGDFTAKPGQHCRFCDFRSICQWRE